MLTNFADIAFRKNSVDEGILCEDDGGCKYNSRDVLGKVVDVGTEFEIVSKLLKVWV